MLVLALQRIMGALSVEVPSGSATGRRKGTVPPAVTSMPITIAGADSADSEGDDAFSADAPISGSALREMQMDPEAAAMWKKFLAGSRAMDVPMWDNRMVEDLPKVADKLHFTLLLRLCSCSFCVGFEPAIRHLRDNVARSLGDRYWRPPMH
jgi:hypothetical protein